MSFTVQGKSILVTGANRGIGKAFVEVLLQQGAKTVYAAARDIALLEPILENHSERIKPIVLDVLSAADIAALENKVGELDVLINNAGVATGCFSTSPDAVEVAKMEMAVNLFGPMAITQALLSKLKDSPQAAIVNIASIAALSNFPTLGPYSATKAALHSYTQGLRADLSQQSIRVLCVYPGPVDTRLAEGVEMDKATPQQVALNTLASLDKGEENVFPDDFSMQMYASYLEHPSKLEQLFSGMTRL